jgi:hypothetical protein
MTPNRANVQKDGFVLGASLRKGLISPLPPVDGLARSTAQIRARGLRQLIRGLVEVHQTPARKLEKGKWKMENRN